MGLIHTTSVECSSWLRNGPIVLLVSVTSSQMANFILTFVVLEIAYLHKGKAEGMISDEEWEKTTLISHLRSCFLYVLLCWQATYHMHLASEGQLSYTCTKD